MGSTSITRVSVVTKLTDYLSTKGSSSLGCEILKPVTERNCGTEYEAVCYLRHEGGDACHEVINVVLTQAAMLVVSLPLSYRMFHAGLLVSQCIVPYLHWI